MGWRSGGAHRAVGTGRRWPRLAAALAVLVAFALVPPVASAAPDRSAEPVAIHKTKHLRVKAPHRTTRGSVVLSGNTFRQASVRVDGGMLPQTVFADERGTFTAEVPLRPGRRNRLTVTAYSGNRHATKRFTVRQRLVDPGGQVSGLVRDVASGDPVAGAVVSYGPRRVVSGADGRYTLAGLPEGLVGISARAPGRLTGLTVAQVAGATGRVGDLLTQELAEPVRVGPDGGSFSGEGWRVEIPAGALPVATDVHVTPLLFTGMLDTYGAPLVDLSPDGLRFARPITVALTPGAVGLDPARAQVVSVNPDGPTGAALPSRTVGDELVVRLSRLDGQEMRIDPRPPHTPFGGMADYCTPFFLPTDAAQAVRYLSGTLLPFLRTTAGVTSHDIAAAFLAGGVPTFDKLVVDNPAALDGFREAPPTRQAVTDVLDQVVAAARAVPPPLSAPAQPTTRELAQFPSAQAPIGQNVNIAWTFPPLSDPGIIAGGVGGVTINDVFVADSRGFSGPLRFVPSASSRGVLTEVELQADLTMHVADSFDFCDGNPGGFVLQQATIPLSRLEATPLPGGGFFGKVIPFRVDPEFEQETRDITDLYPGNDRDDDGVPDRQPWEGATFPLDNCPDAANSDQGDSDGDGVGNACDSDEPTDGGLPPGGVPNDEVPQDGADVPDDGPTDPGAGGSYGDPHFVSYDGASFSFHGAGDYVIAESTTDDFLVQGRYVRTPGTSTTNITLNRGAAARVGDSVIAFGDDTTSFRRDPQVATLDGEPLELTPGTTTPLPGGAVLRYVPTEGPVVRWPDGTELAAGRWVGDNVFLTLAPGRWGQVRGLLGDADRDPSDDLTARDGTVIRDPYDRDQLYGVFGASWRVEGAQSLFRTAIPPDGALPVVPPDVAAASGLSAAARAAAEQLCRDRGLRPGAGLEQCILDVGLTGDGTFADDALVVANRLRQGVDLGALGAPVEDTVEIELGQRVSGSLDTRFAADVFHIDLQAGDGVRISTFGACPGAGTYSITLVAPSGRPLGRTRGADCGTLGVTGLRESGRYQVRVFDTGGFTGGYEFRVDEAGLSCQATEVAANDDESGPEVPLPFEVDFLGRRFSSLWVNNNGNVTFDGPLSAFTPVPMEGFDRAVVAAWFADVDTRGAGSQPVRYGFGEVDGRRAFCVDYDQVGYFNRHDDRLNSFQLFVVDRGDVAEGAFDIVFRYRQLRWETGDASGGTNGLGDTSAGVGYANGSGEPGTFLDVPGSRQPGSFLDGAPGGLAQTSTNSSQPGVHVYPIR